MLKLFVALLTLFSATPAFADLTAIYGGHVESLRFEIAANGDMRIGGCCNGSYEIYQDGEGFLIERVGPNRDFRVRRIADVSVVMREIISKKLAEVRADKSKMLNTFIGPLFQRGEVSINGRVGRAYYLTAQPSSPTEKPELVISEDASLAPLSNAALRYMDTAANTTAVGIVSPHTLDRERDALKLGAPLRFMNSDLSSVSYDPISADRFKLPARVESLEEVRNNPPPLFRER